MALLHSPQIVRDGLVLYLDAANIKSYPGSGTTWFDLSGIGNNGTLVNSPSFNSENRGYFAFDGINDYVSFSTYSQPIQDSTTSFTWNIWVYPLRNSFGDIYMGNRFDGGALVFNKLTSKNWEFFSSNFGGDVPLNKWLNITLVKNETSLLYYRNGVLHASIISSLSKPNQAFYIGGDPGTSSEFALAYISNVIIYHRPLSIQEVKQNFEALRGRYGI
jgi:hypothetical protein